jgi:hypothetical protein
MSRINLFKKHLGEKRAVKIIAGIDNFDIDRIKKVVSAADKAGASAIDICADGEILKEVREMTNLPIFVSSIVPSELAKAVENGADAIELGNFDALYKKGLRFGAKDVLKLVEETISLLTQEVFFCVTVPGHISVAEQIELAVKLEELGIDLIQTEGAAVANVQNDGARGLMETAQVSIANTIELVRNVEIPVMTASGITPTTAPLAFAAGASAIGVGSCVNKSNSTLSMIASATSLVEIASKNAQKETVSV